MRYLIAMLVAVVVTVLVTVGTVPLSHVFVLDQFPDPLLVVAWPKDPNARTARRERKNTEGEVGRWIGRDMHIM